MIVFKVLNPIVQTCAIKVIKIVIGFSGSIEKDNNILVWAHVWKSLCMCLLLGSYFYLGAYL
jgi:hypothetical protein